MSLPDNKFEAPDPVACPECGEDMNGTTCDSCGYEWDGLRDEADEFERDSDDGYHDF
jgi:tRNA(Ile2) C34 agmatinyltransferase TiaS